MGEVNEPSSDILDVATKPPVYSPQEVSQGGVVTRVPAGVTTVMGEGKGEREMGRGRGRGEWEGLPKASLFLSFPSLQLLPLHHIPVS